MHTTALAGRDSVGAGKSGHCPLSRQRAPGWFLAGEADEADRVAWLLGR